VRQLEAIQTQRQGGVFRAPPFCFCNPLSVSISHASQSTATAFRLLLLLLLLLPFGAAREAAPATEVPAVEVPQTARWWWQRGCGSSNNNHRIRRCSSIIRRKSRSEGCLKQYANCNQTCWGLIDIQQQQ
jgi:hypothetical protein